MGGSEWRDDYGGQERAILHGKSGFHLSCDGIITACQIVPEKPEF